MVTMWFILNVPIIIMSQVIPFIQFTESMGIVYEVLYLIFCLNNIANPILYAITMRDFREGYKSLLLCRKLENKTERVNTISRTGSTSVGSVNRGVQDSVKQSTKWFHMILIYFVGDNSFFNALLFGERGHSSLVQIRKALVVWRGGANVSPLYWVYTRARQ